MVNVVTDCVLIQRSFDVHRLLLLVRWRRKRRNTSFRQKLFCGISLDKVCQYNKQYVGVSEGWMMIKLSFDGQHECSNQTFLEVYNLVLFSSTTGRKGPTLDSSTKHILQDDYSYF